MERTTIFERESWGDGLGYSNVERDVLLKGGELELRYGEKKSGYNGTYTVEHAVLLARPPEIDGTLANKVIVRVWRKARNSLNLSELHADILSLNALRTQANFNGLIRILRLRGEDKTM